MLRSESMWPGRSNISQCRYGLNAGQSAFYEHAPYRINSLAAQQWDRMTIQSASTFSAILAVIFLSDQPLNSVVFPLD